MECEYCGCRRLASAAVDDEGHELYFTDQCQGCGIIFQHRNDLYRIARFTNAPLDVRPEKAGNSERPRPSAGEAGQPSFWSNEVRE